MGPQTKTTVPSGVPWENVTPYMYWQFLIMTPFESLRDARPLMSVYRLHLNEELKKTAACFRHKCSTSFLNEDAVIER